MNWDTLIPAALGIGGTLLVTWITQLRDDKKTREQFARQDAEQEREREDRAKADERRRRDEHITLLRQVHFDFVGHLDDLLIGLGRVNLKELHDHLHHASRGFNAIEISCPRMTKLASDFYIAGLELVDHAEKNERDLSQEMRNKFILARVAYVEGMMMEIGDLAGSGVRRNP
jgi:hypothetical protein